MHESGPQERPAGGVRALDDEANADTKTYFGLDLNALYRASRAKTSDRVGSIVKPLAALLLDQKMLADPAFKFHHQTKWALRFFNSELLTAVREGATVDAILKAYANRVLAGCDSVSLEGCRNLAFFSRDQQGTSSVLKVLALRAQDVREYYLLIKLAHETQNESPDAELSEMTYKRMIELVKTYVDVRQNGDYVYLKTRAGLSAAEKRDFGMWTSFLGGKMLTSPSKSSDGAQTAQFFQWLSSSDMVKIFGSSFCASITRMLAKQLSSPEVWAEFIKVFNRDQRDFELSYTNTLKRVTAHDPTLLTRLGVKPFDMEAAVQAKSPILAEMLLLNRLLQLRPASAEMYLHGFSGATAEQSVDMIDSIVRVSLVDRMLRTHKMMAKVYRDSLANGRADSDLIYDVIRLSDERLSAGWSDYVSRIEQIQFFFNEQIRDRYASERGTALAAKLARVNNLLNNFNPTIQYMVTYPNMLMLGYYAAKVNLSMVFKTFFGSTVQINKNLTLHELFDAKMPPMFLFTKFKPGESDRERLPIDSVQMMWALNFAVAADLPKLYGIPAENFISTLFNTYNQWTNDAMRKVSERHRQALQPDGIVSRINEQCAALDRPQVPLFETVVKLNRFQGGVFKGTLSSTSFDSTMNSAFSLVTINADRSGSLVEAIETLRTDVDPRLRRMMLVRTAFASAANPDQAALRSLDRQMSDVLGRRQLVLDTTRKILATVPPCLIRFRQTEDQRRLEFAAMEFEFLRQTALAYRTVRAAKSDANAFDQLARLPEFKNIDRALPIAAALNQLFATKLRFDQTVFIKTLGYRDDYFANAGFQRTREGRIVFNYRVQELYLRMAAYATGGFEGLSVSVKSDAMEISYPVNLREMRNHTPAPGAREMQIASADEERFRVTAMDMFKTTLNKWYESHTATTTFFQSVLMLKTILFKYDMLGELDLKQTVECTGRCAEEREADMRARLHEIFDFNLLALNTLNLKRAELPLLNSFQANSFYNVTRSDYQEGEGPRVLFIQQNLNGTYNGFADEVLSYMTSVMLGKQPSFLGVRKWAEEDWYRISNDNEGMRGVISSEELAKRYDYMVKAREYFHTLQSRGELLSFDLDPGIEKQIEVFHTMRIDADVKSVKMFSRELLNWGATHPLPPAFFTLRVGEVEIPLISQSLLSTYDMIMKKFHDETEHVFDKN